MAKKVVKSVAKKAADEKKQVFYAVVGLDVADPDGVFGPYASVDDALDGIRNEAEGYGWEDGNKITILQPVAVRRLVVTKPVEAQYLIGEID